MTIEASVDTAGATAGSATGSTVTASVGAFDPSLNGTIDPGSASFVQQLGIFLQRTNEGASLRTENVSPMSRRGGPTVFPLLPGSYRLRTSGYSGWFVKSATAGGTDLLTAGPGGGWRGARRCRLRLVVSNQAATMRGTTKIAEQLGTCYIYPDCDDSEHFAGDQCAERKRMAASCVGRFRREATGWWLRRHGCMSTWLISVVERQLAPYMKTVTVGAGETERMSISMRCRS